jgi:hypothetical protein
MQQQDKALANAAQVEQLADSLSITADALHARVMRAIKKRPTGDAPPATPEPAISQAEAQTLFEQEVALRQQANSLYMDAARYAVAPLDTSQRSVIELVYVARQEIGKIDTVKDLIGIGASLLSLATAVITGKPDAMLSALKKLRDHAGRQGPAEPEA